MKGKLIRLTLLSASVMIGSTWAESKHDHDAHQHPSTTPQPEQTATPIDPSHVDATFGNYPLKVCPVSGEKLGAMGDPYVYKHEGREIRFCCKGCVKDFTKNPARYLAQLDAAVIAQQKASYPLKICLVSLDDLIPEETIDYVANNNMLFRLCCKACKKELENNLRKFTDKLIKARKGNF